MGSNAVEDGGYSSLNDFKLEIVNQEGDVNGSFSLCFWLYLPADSSPFPSTLLRQHHSDSSSHAPFLVLTANKEMVVYPIHFVPQEAPIPSDGTEIPSAKTKIEFEFPLNKWVHIGCEMSTDIIRLHINGEIVGETCISLTFDSSRKVSLVGLGANEDDLVDGFVHGVEIFPITSSIKDYFVKDPPVQLHVDSLSATDIEEDNDGVWSVVGGKASCRRNFSLDVNLMDAFGHSVNKEMEVIASLTYADNGAYVEKPDDAEAPLLTSYDGIEFASWDRPSKLINGRASFKLKISQLSSKCDNRLFRIKFNIPKMGRRYPFLEVFSRSIRCISRNRNTRPSTLIWKRPTSAMHSGSGTSWLDGGSVEPVHNIVHEAKPSPSSKRVKLGQGNPFVNLSSNTSFKQGDHEGNKDDRLNGRISEGRQEMRDGTTHNSSSDSDSSEATNSCKSRSSNGSSVSDLTVFKYCLGTVTEKSLLLKDLANSASEQDLMEFAVQVSQLSGCLHHRNQIRISKRMIEEGTNAWNLISRNNHNGLWDNMILVISELFMKVARCRNRFLTQQDFEVLRRIGGCQESVSRENFEKLWCWLYPVAFGLSQNGLNEMWDSRWIEGLVTKEEAESSLQGPGGGLVDPGTFVLRFPTSRSWPHPDAGNLIVTYVGSDFAIHHRLLSLDFFYSCGGNGKSLKEMLLEERELSRLGRITRSLRLV
ncbi:SH2 domain-containing protein A isoform X2 [Cynara cardunculus var. scolymus]|uniref:SH2 domain-containing protein A isoform X2 n=1 Tax=Cynara cardunculus var. scolymus TaxID=59895 RepID=UPI000D624634|nr:SH2 domain-containing protein A isoform X2 [Cynara cardunculus var. scolymus]